MNYEFVTLQPLAFFGYRREILAELQVAVADESKSILDSLSPPKYAGAVAEVSKALHIKKWSDAHTRAESVTDIQRWKSVASRLQRESLLGRLGLQRVDNCRLD